MAVRPRTRNLPGGNKMRDLKDLSLSPITRRRFVAGAAATGAATATMLRAPAILAQSQKPLKIGMLNTFSKMYAVLGQDNVDGMMLWLEQNGADIAGRKVELIK